MLERALGIQDLFLCFIHIVTIRYKSLCRNGSRKVSAQSVGKWPHSHGGFAPVDWHYLISPSSGPSPIQGLSQNLRNSHLLTAPNGRIDSIEIQEQLEVGLRERRADHGASCNAHVILLRPCNLLFPIRDFLSFNQASWCCSGLHTTWLIGDRGSQIRRSFTRKNPWGVCLVSKMHVVMKTHTGHDLRHTAVSGHHSSIEISHDYQVWHWQYVLYYLS